MEQNKPPAGDCPQLLLDSQLCFPLYAAARKAVNHYTPYLKPFGITYTQYIVLLALWESGSATVGDLCRRLYLDNGTITPLLKKMEEAGIVSRSRSRQDERVVTVQVTENVSPTWMSLQTAWRSSATLAIAPANMGNRKCTT